MRIKMDIYKRQVTIIIVFLTILLISCEQSFESQVTMTTDKIDSLKIGLSGSWGTANIDWGNGSTVKSNDLWSLPVYFNKNYSDKKKHTIHINGSRLNTINGIYCFNNQLTSLDISKIPKLKTLEILRNKLKNIDVSRNPELTILNCTWNQLKSLDVSKNAILENLSCENNQLKGLNVRNNTKLRSLFLRSNQLSETELNALFETLHKNKTSDFQTVYIGGNPGVEKCNKSIAINKGWKVDTEPVKFE
jgi:hypothetical protein